MRFYNFSLPTPLPNTTTIRARSCEISLLFYHTTWYHIPEGSNLHSYCLGNFKSHYIPLPYFCFLQLLIPDITFHDAAENKLLTAQMCNKIICQLHFKLNICWFPVHLNCRHLIKRIPKTEVSKFPLLK